MIKITSNLCGICLVQPSIVAAFPGGMPLVFDTNNGTSVAILLRCEGAKLLRLLPEQSSTQRFRDNLGKDLLTANGQPAPASWDEVPRSPDFDPGMVVRLHGSVPPTANATSLELQATLMVQTHDGLTTRDVPNAALQVGFTDPGGLDLKITNVGTSILHQPNPGEYAVTFLTSLAAAQAIDGIDFLDAAGNNLSPGELELPVPAPGVGWYREFYFTAPIASATIRLHLWSNVQSQKVPVQAKTRLGIPPVKT